MTGRTLLALGSLSLVWALGCATPSEPEDSNEGTLAESYIRRVGFEMPFNETILLHWPKSAMPLRWLPHETFQKYNPAVLARDTAGLGFE